MPWPARPEHPPGAASRRSIQVGSASFVITDLLDVKDIPQVEPLRRGRIMRISAPILTSAIVSTVSVVHVLDRVAAVVGISGFEGARGSKCALAGCGPEREVSHARQPLESNMRQHA